MKRIACLGLGLALWAYPACAQDVPAAPPEEAVFSNVQWNHRPTLQADDYPPIPLVLMMSGAATLRCIAATDGSVRGCEVIAEDGLVGFGDSAIRVVERGSLHPQTVDGVAQNATFTVRIPFEMGPDTGPPPFAGEEPSAQVLAGVQTMVGERYFDGAILEQMIGGLDAADRARVEIPFIRAIRDKGAVWREAMALFLARTAPPEVVAALEAGQPMPRIIGPGRADVSAMDRLAAADRQVRERARQYFCAQHACPQQD